MRITYKQSGVDIAKIGILIIISILWILSGFARAEIKIDLEIDRDSYEITNETVKDGSTKDYYPDGAIKAEVNFKDYKADGEFKQYYPNGILQKMINFSKGKQHGVSKEYYENGNIKSECNYQDGILQEKCKDYDENGNLKREITYIDGNPFGPLKIFYVNGKLFQERDGMIKAKYDSKGEKIYVFQGTLKEYYENGSLKAAENYEDGIREGLFEEFYENGLLKSKKEYKQDKLVSEIYYDQEGKIIAKIEEGH